MRELFQDGLYHKDVYFPNELRIVVRYLLSRPYKLEPSKHYFEKIKKINLNEDAYRTALHGDVIEAEVIEGQIVKIVTRVKNRFASNNYMCFAIQIGDTKNKVDKNTVVVKTVWLNCGNDNHTTLDTSKYLHKAQ